MIREDLQDEGDPSEVIHVITRPFRHSLTRYRAIGAALVVASALPARAEVPATVQADQSQAGWLTAKGRSPTDVEHGVAAARVRACGETMDPILGCGKDVKASEATQPFVVRFETAGVGLNANVMTYFPWWGKGLNFGVAGGASVRFWSWFYEGFHRISALQLDVDVGYRLAGNPHGIWYAALGPVFQGLDFLGPVVKAQVFVSRPISWDGFDKGGRIDAMGVTVSLGLDFPLWNPWKPRYLTIDPETAVRTPTDKRPALDSNARTYLFQDIADDNEQRWLRKLEKDQAKAQQRQTESGVKVK